MMVRPADVSFLQAQVELGTQGTVTQPVQLRDREGASGKPPICSSGRVAPAGTSAAAWWRPTAETLRPDAVLHGTRDMTGATALVWFRRDLRVRDHAPLAEAMHFESALGLVVIEPQWLASPECDPRHVGFLLDCVAELQLDLAARGLPVLLRTGAMPQVLQSLRREFRFTHLASRLRWHCHFMQRLEDEPAIEWRNVARTVAPATQWSMPACASCAPRVG